MTIIKLNLERRTYTGDGVEQTCTTTELTERDFTPTQLVALAHIIANAGRDPVSPASSASQRPTLIEIIDRVADAKQQGYTGESCNDCGSFAVKRTGKCTTCEACGATGGCG